MLLPSSLCVFSTSDHLLTLGHWSALHRLVIVLPLGWVLARRGALRGVLTLPLLQGVLLAKRLAGIALAGRVALIRGVLKWSTAGGSVDWTLLLLQAHEIARA